MMKMYNNLFFFNHYHNGDVHLSREFVKIILNKINYKKSFYISNSSKELFYDLNVEPINFSDFSLNQDTQILVKDNDIFINTWIGQQNRRYLNPSDRFAVSAKSNLNLFNDIYAKIGIQPVNNIRETVPDINFSNLPFKAEIDNFFNLSKKYVLLCNNYPKSFQAESNDLSELINHLSEQNKNIFFIVSNKFENINKKENVYFIEDIINTNNNLIQISYISTFCNLIFGRASGPYEVSKVKQNLFNYDKKFICYSKEKIDASWIDDLYCESEILWSNNFSEIKNILERECKKINT